MQPHSPSPGPVAAPRSWLPMIAFGLLVLGGLLALTWQARRWRELRRDNAALRTELAHLAHRHEGRAAVRQQEAEAAEASRRQREEGELAKLRAETEQLRLAVQELPALRAEAKRLQAERAEAAARAGIVEEDPFKTARERAQRLQCVNQLKQVGLAARIWANDHQDVMPPNFLVLSNELTTPKVLICPADLAHKQAKTWAEFDEGSVSYEYLSPGIRETMGPDIVLTRCPAHYVVGLLDGSVQSLDRSTHRVEKVEGRYKIVRVPPPEPSSPP